VITANQLERVRKSSKSSGKRLLAVNVQHPFRHITQVKDEMGKKVFEITAEIISVTDFYFFGKAKARLFKLENA